MPFTVSHVAAILPFVGRGRLVTSALVIGAMAPDIPYFLQLGGESGLTHSAIGIVTVDLLMGLALLALWMWWLAPAAWLLAPAPIRAAWPAGWGRWGWARPAAVVRDPEGRWRERDTREPGSCAWWGWASVSLMLGAATHVVWDAFSHAGRFGVELVPWLAAEQGPLEGYRWMQYLGGALGLLAVGVAVLVSWRRGLRAHGGRPAAPVPEGWAQLDPEWPPRQLVTTCRLVLVAVPAVAVAGVVLPALLGGDIALRSLAFHTATAAGGALLLAGIAVASVLRS